MSKRKAREALKGGKTKGIEGSTYRYYGEYPTDAKAREAAKVLREKQGINARVLKEGEGWVIYVKKPEKK